MDSRSLASDGDSGCLHHRGISGDLVTNVGVELFRAHQHWLGAKLGPILWQFPPNFKFDRDRFERFLKILPADTSEAAALAERHDSLQPGSGPPEDRRPAPLRYAVEIRNPSFQVPEFVALLRERGVALVVADTAGKWPYLEEPTADFMYLRLHGDVELYASGYTDAALDRWASRIRAWSEGQEPRDARRVTALPAPRRAFRDVYCYFDNDAKVKAPFDARTLMAKLGAERAVEAYTPKRRRI